MGSDAHFQASPEILDWVQAQALAGPLKDIHRVVYKPLLLCLGPLSCWKVNLLPSLRFWMLWTRFSLWLSQYLGALSFTSTLMCPSVPAAEKQLHSMRLLAHFTFGMVLCRWWAKLVSFKHDAWNWGSSDQRKFFSQSECPLGAFLQIPSVFSCVYTEERIEFGHTSIKPRLMECCSGVCPSVDFSCLHTWSWSSTRLTIRFLGTTLTKALLHQLLSLARRPALRRILVVSNIFH